MNLRPCAGKCKTVSFHCDHCNRHTKTRPCSKERSLTFMELADAYARYYTTDGITVYEAPSVTDYRSRPSSRAPSRNVSPASSRGKSDRSRSPGSRSSPTRKQLGSPGKMRYRSPNQSNTRSKSTDQYRNRNVKESQLRSQSFGRNQSRSASPKVNPTRKQSPQRSRPYTPKAPSGNPYRNSSPTNCCKCCASMDRLIQQLREKCAKYSRAVAYDDLRRVRSAHSGGIPYYRGREENSTTTNDCCICSSCQKHQREKTKPPKNKTCVCCKCDIVPIQEIKKVQSLRCVCCKCSVNPVQPKETQILTQNNCCSCCTCKEKAKSAKEIFKERDLNNFLQVDSHKKPIHPRKTVKKNKRTGTRSKTPAPSGREQGMCDCYTKLKEAVKELVDEPNRKAPPDFDYPDYPDYYEEGTKKTCVCCKCSTTAPSRKSSVGGKLDCCKECKKNPKKERHGDKVVYDEPLDGDNYVIINYEDVGVCVYVHKKTSKDRLKSKRQRRKR